MPLPRGVWSTRVHNTYTLLPSTSVHSTRGVLSPSLAARVPKTPSQRVRHVIHVAQPELLPRHLGPSWRRRIPHFVPNKALHGSPELAVTCDRETPTNSSETAARDTQSYEKRALNSLRRCPPPRFADNETRWSPKVAFTGEVHTRWQREPMAHPSHARGDARRGEPGQVEPVAQTITTLDRDNKGAVEG
jgi:hypothetical protein